MLLVPRPAPLPPGATPLKLLTQPPSGFPAIGLGCPAVLVLPIRVGRDGDAMRFYRADDGRAVSIAWPSGYSARMVDGRAELVAPSGAVLAREGAVISGLAGSAADDGTMRVCISIGSRIVVSPPP